MPQLPGVNREQIQFFALETVIESDNEVRAIEALVNATPLEDLGFVVKGKSHEGRPAFSAKMLLKLYIYGYRNGIRSSRKLAKACQCNVELWWLLHYQQPCYKVIANFRKDNAKALRQAFRFFNELYLEWELFGGALAAIDGSKIRGQNSKKNNYNAGKIQRHLDYIDDKLDAYFAEAETLDEAESKEEQLETLNDKIEELLDRRWGYEQLSKKLEESGERQLSSNDPDTRALPLHMGIVEVGYNVQTAVDDKHYLIAHYEVENEKDDTLLAKVAIKTKEALAVEILDVLADKGYHSGAEFKACADAQIKTLVAPKENYNPKKNAAYQKQRFEYDAEQDEYTCPEGKQLKTNGSWYQKNTGKHRRSYRIKRYVSSFTVCNKCPAKDQCLTKKQQENRHGRAIERSEYEGYVVANAARVKAEWEKYRRRQAIVEPACPNDFGQVGRHPFGTIKRSWSYTYTLMKGKEKVSGEFGLVFTSYNFRRVVSILGVKGGIERLKSRSHSFFVLWRTVSSNRCNKFNSYCDVPRRALAA